MTAHALSPVSGPRLRAAAASVSITANPVPSVAGSRVPPVLSVRSRDVRRARPSAARLSDRMDAVTRFPEEGTPLGVGRRGYGPRAEVTR